MLGITHAQASNQRGFTLIEMSIVLVIIGLIIGGILKGQEIIESSRQKNVITQIDSVRAAINTFADKYNALPGDYSLASTRIQAGLNDGDDSGLVGENAGDGAAMDAVLGDGSGDVERVDFWNHLAAAELVGGTTVGGTTTNFGETNALPAIAVPGGGMTMVYGDHDSVANNARQSHWGRLHKNLGTAVANNVASGVLSGKRAFEVDLKVDDANSYNGNVRVADTPAAECSNATGGYAALSDDTFCAVYFELIQ